MGYPEDSTVESGDSDVGLSYYNNPEKPWENTKSRFWVKRKDVKEFPGGENTLYLYGSSVANSSSSPEEAWQPVEPGVPPLLQGTLIYCRILYAVDQDVVREILEEGYDTIWFKVKLTTSQFSPEPVEIRILNKVKTKLQKEVAAALIVPSELVETVETEPEFTYMADVYAYPALIRAVKPAEGGGWTVDSDVRIEVTWYPGVWNPETGEIITMEEIMERWREELKTPEEETVWLWGDWLNLTFSVGGETYTYTMPSSIKLRELWNKGASYVTGLTATDIGQIYAKPEIEDPVGIIIYEHDIEGYGAEDIQAYAAKGELNMKVRKTSPSIFTLKVDVSKPGKVDSATSIVMVPFGQMKPPEFKVEQPWTLYVNMVGGGVTVERAKSYRGTVHVKVKIEPEAGGIQKIQIWKGGSLLVEEELPDNIHWVPEGPIILKPEKVEYEGFGYQGEYELTFTDKEGGGQQTYTLVAYNSWGATTAIQFTPEEVKPLLEFTNQLIYAVGAAIVIILAVAVMQGLIKRE